MPGGAETFRASADVYDRHVGRYGSSLAAALIAFAALEPGMRALDLGCGPDALTAALAERLGAEHVRAAEPSEPFAAACRSRLPGVEVVAASAAALPFADDAFDAVLLPLVVTFMPDAAAGVREMARVTRPGGVVASCVAPFPTGLAPSGAYCAGLDPDRRAALRDAYRRRLGVGDGPFELTARDSAVSSRV